MSIGFDYYRIFNYVAKLGNITQAAEYLFCNQPNVTRAVKLLETELGCTLFNRSSRGVTLTPQGKRLYEHIEIAVSHIEVAEKELNDEKNLQSGTVAIGTTEVALRCFLLPILNRYRREYRNIKIVLTSYTARQAIKALREGLVDFSVITTPAGETNGIKLTNLKGLKTVAICGEYFTGLHSGIHSLSELAEYPIISLDRASASFEFYRDYFTARRIPYSPAIEVANADQILPIVKNNLGIGFLAEDMLTEEITGIYKIAVNEAFPEKTVALAEKNNASLSFAAEKLYEMIINSLDRN